MRRDATQEFISGLIRGDKPCMVARFGGIELDAISRGVYIAREGGRVLKTFEMLKGEIGPFWWDHSVMAGVCWNAGFFPPEISALERYSRFPARIRGNSTFWRPIRGRTVCGFCRELIFRT